MRAYLYRYTHGNCRSGSMGKRTAIFALVIIDFPGNVVVRLATCDSDGLPAKSLSVSRQIVWNILILSAAKIIKVNWNGTRHHQ
jgi:hypothetical protein